MLQNTEQGSQKNAYHKTNKNIKYAYASKTKDNIK